MPDDLNLYGDSLISTTGAHGADIASQRLDDLDRRALLDVLGHETSPRVCVDLGCGSGWQGIRFAMLGADAYLFDLLEEPGLIAALRREHGLPLTYRSGDLTALAAHELPARIDLTFSQRFIHYLRFDQALALVRLCAAKMPSHAMFYLSASGLDSELGTGYAGRASTLAVRFAPLAPPLQARHGIMEPVCLYSEADLSALMMQAGFSAMDVWRSPFGNIKGVFRKSA